MPLIRKSSSSAPVPAAEQVAQEDVLSSGDEDARWAAARAAADHPERMQQLADALAREKSPRVRAAIFSSLCAAPNARAVELIIDFLRSDDAHLRMGALDALHLMTSQVDPYLPQLLSDGDDDVRLLACELVRHVPAARAVDLLSTLLDREARANVCASAIEVLAEVGDARALAALERCEARFRGDVFVEFSVRVTRSRIQMQTTGETAQTSSIAPPRG